jgi:hypothetical protein
MNLFFLVLFFLKINLKPLYKNNDKIIKRAYIPTIQ